MGLPTQTLKERFGGIGMCKLVATSSSGSAKFYLNDVLFHPTVYVVDDHADG